MSAVEAVKVTKKYKNSLSFAIKNISLEIEPGRIFTLLGRNVAGAVWEVYKQHVQTEKL